MVFYHRHIDTSNGNQNFPKNFLLFKYHYKESVLYVQINVKCLCDWTLHFSSVESNLYFMHVKITVWPIYFTIYGQHSGKMSFHAVNRMFNLGQFINVSPMRFSHPKSVFSMTWVSILKRNSSIANLETTNTVLWHLHMLQRILRYPTSECIVHWVFFQTKNPVMLAQPYSRYTRHHISVILCNHLCWLSCDTGTDV